MDRTGPGRAGRDPGARTAKIREMVVFFSGIGVTRGSDHISLASRCLPSAFLVANRTFGPPKYTTSQNSLMESLKPPFLLDRTWVSGFKCVSRNPTFGTMAGGEGRFRTRHCLSGMPWNSFRPFSTPEDCLRRGISKSPMNGLAHWNHRPKSPPPPPPTENAAPLFCRAPGDGRAPPPPPCPPSFGGSGDTTKTRSGPPRVRMSSGERPMGAAKGKPSDTEALCQPPPPPPRPPPLSLRELPSGDQDSKSRTRKAPEIPPPPAPCASASQNDRRDAAMVLRQDTPLRIPRFFRPTNDAWIG